MSLNSRLNALLLDPSVSDWLKDSLMSGMSRDPVDAANDAETLSSLLGERSDAIARVEANALLLNEVAGDP